MKFSLRGADDGEAMTATTDLAPVTRTEMTTETTTDTAAAHAARSEGTSHG
jgi:hypothetical protein